jgi:tryptophan synthase alpha chain
MSRLATAFEQIRARSEPGLVAYVTAGDPTLERTADIRLVAVTGADVIEVGVLFSIRSLTARNPKRVKRALASGTI